MTKENLIAKILVRFSVKLLNDFIKEKEQIQCEDG
jgi:hypothetical protein